jgi:NTP pyrophosphatase (non-canonical NTP hydrolase)
MDDRTTIDELKRLAVEFRNNRDWKQFHDPKNLATGLSIESGELLELFLWKNPDEVSEYASSEKGQRRLGEEIADVFIYLLYLSDATGIDLSAAFRSKLELNGEKYPVEKSFGRHGKYDEI